MIPPLSPFQALANHVAAAPEQPIFQDLAGRTLSRRGLLDLIQATAQAYLQAGLLQGQTVALLITDGMEWSIHLLALERIGAVTVLLPPFFSDAQLRAVLLDSRADTLIADQHGRARLDGVVARTMAPCPAVEGAVSLPPIPCDGRQIAYSSGTSGQPSGVVHSLRRLDAKAAALAAVTGACAEDRVLSILPMALLLEQMVAVRSVLLVGAHVTFAQAVLACSPETIPQALALTADAQAPTVGVLTPELLKAWVFGLTLLGRRGPESLRFLAVGGAAVAPALGDRAWQLGLPIYEGYGLTETCSVATVNRPGQRIAGTVGLPLPGVRMLIEDGELIVESQQRMIRYQGGGKQGAPERWKTGDVGQINADGSVVVLGRLDSVMVLPSGRNVSPEWIESTLSADPRLRHCCVLATDESHPVAVVESLPGYSDENIIALAQTLMAELPDYARPQRIIVVAAGSFAANGVLTGNGRLRRRLAVDVWRQRIARLDTANPEQGGSPATTICV
jgi:long-subunit acyl-CoA synthetase (AMP-forming)